MVPPDRVLGFLLHDVARLLRKRFEQRARSAGLNLTRSQWQVLAYLAQNEGIHQGALADILDVEPITLVRILDRLQAGDLIERRAHASDRRIRLLYLRPAARPLLDAIREIGQAVREDALQAIPRQDRERLLETLCTMKTNLIEASGTHETRETEHG